MNNALFAGRVVVRLLLPLGLWAFTLAVILWFFREISFVALGLLAACAIASVLRWIADRLPWRRSVSVTAIWLAALLFIAGLIALGVSCLVPTVRRELRTWPETRTTINDWLESASNSLGLERTWTTQDLLPEAVSILTDRQEAQILKITAETLTAAGVVFAFLVFGALFIAVERDGRLSRPLIYIAPPDSRPDLVRAVDELWYRLRRWVLGALASMTIIGIASAIGYSVVGLKFAITLGIIAGFLEIIPMLGPILSFTLAVLVASTQGWAVFLGVVGVYTVVQVVESYMVLPLIMREAVHIPPMVTLFTVVLWGLIFGVAGFMLVVPINLTIGALLRHLTRFEGLPESQASPPSG